MKFCPECGFELQDSDLFCCKCGNKSEVAEKTDGSAEAFIKLTTPVPSTDEQDQPEVHPPKGKKKLPLTVILVAVIILLTGVIALTVLEMTGVINIIDGVGKDNADNFTYEPTTDENGSIISGTQRVWIPTKTVSRDGGYDVWLFDDNYNLSKVICYDADGTEEFRREYTYDSKGNMLTNRAYEYGIESELQVYTYDSDGNRLNEVYTVDGEEHSRYEYTYDSTGKLITKMCYDRGKEDAMIKHTYDSNGNLIVQESFYYMETTYSRSEYTYDSKGNMLSKIIYENGGIGEDEETHRFVYAYNSDGNILKETIYIYGKEISYTEYSYDSAGKQLSAITYSNGEEFGRYEYTYDSNGNILTEIQYESGIEIERTECRYDSDNNMTDYIYYYEGQEMCNNKYEWTCVELPQEQAQKVQDEIELIL